MSQKVPFMSIMAIKALFMCCLSVALLTTVWLGTLLEDDHWTSSPLGGVEELESRSPLRRTQLSERASFIKARGESIVTSKGAEDLFDMDSGKPYSELDPLYSNEHKRNTDRRSTDCRRPRRLHLSPASSVVSKEFSDTTVFVIDMYISFTVDKYGCPESEKAAPVVFYGKVVDDDEHKHRIDTSSLERLQFDFYSTLLTIESSSWIFHGIMKDLAVDTEFWYEIVVHDSPHGVGVESGGDRTIALMQDQGIIQTSSLRETRSLPTISSGKRTFFTPSALGNPTSLAFVGDWGTTKNSLAVMQKLSEAIKPNTAFEHLNVDGAKVSTDAISPRNLRVHDYRTKGLQPQSESQQPPISAVIVVGDLSYANGHLSGWETWLEAMHPLFAHIPILVAAGNHELECDQRKFLLFQAYENYFRTPYHHQRQPAHFEPVPLGPKRLECTHPSDFVGAVYQGGNSYYSFRQGLVHLIVLNSYIDTTKGSMQYQWLESELKTRINRAFTPWLIVVFHAPLHTTFHGHNSEYPWTVQSFMRENHIDLEVVTGSSKLV